MIWCVRKAHNFDSKALVNFAVACAEDVLPIYEKQRPGKTAVRKCIEATKGYIEGRVTLEELRKKRDAANTAANTADAYSAANAANAANAAAAAAAYAVAVAYAADADAKKHQQYADLLRQMHPNPWREAAKRGKEKP
jgi:hypothetical protein